MFFIEYRDPIFGIIIFLLLIVIVSFSSYWWGVFKSKNETQQIKDFIRSFEHIKNKEDFAKLIKDFPVSLETLTLIAINYTKSGDFDKAIAIYLNALEQVKTKEQKIYLLTLLGKTYFLAGFLQRSKNIFLDAVKLQPRNKEALAYLSAVFEKLYEFDHALEALDALFEIGSNITDEKVLINTKKIAHNKQNLSKIEVAEKLYELCENKIAQRQYIEYMIKNDLEIPYKDVKKFDYENLIDLFWYYNASKLPEAMIEDSKLLQQLYSAKSELDLAKGSDIFELDVLIKLKGLKEDVDIGFEYTCQNCKNSFPIYFNRCPKCMYCGVPQINMILGKKDMQEYKFMI